MRRSAIIVFFIAGCYGSPPHVPVKGTVTLDGKTIEHCQVCFYPAVKDGDPRYVGYGRGMTDASGAFVIHDVHGKEGLFPGKYKVSFQLYVTADGKAIGPDAKPDEVYGSPKNVIPLKYQKDTTTPIEVEVTAKGYEGKFDLTSK